MIIGINGRIGVGKDTFGDLIRELDSNWEIKKYAEKLKEVAAIILGVPRVKFEDQEYKLSELGHEWDRWFIRFKHISNDNNTTYDGPYATSEEAATNLRYKQHVVQSWVNTTIVQKPMTVRDFLQLLGTDAMRVGLHTNAWVNALFADYKLRYAGESEGSLLAVEPKWVVTDMRFPNEAQAIKDKGGLVVRIVRPGNPLPKSEHVSETALDTWDFDDIIVNKGSLEDLKECAQSILNTIKVSERKSISGI
jgi:hypothetical protein